MEYNMTLPWSPDAEEQVIAAAIIKPSTLDEICTECGLSADDFYNSEYKKIFACIVKMREDNRHIDILNVALAMNYGENEKNALTDIVRKLATTYAVKHYAKIVRELAQRRRYINAANTIQNICADTSKSVDSIGDEIEIIMSDNRIERETFSAAEIFPAVYENIASRYDKKGDIPGERTGWISLDRRIGGLEPGELIIIGARPGMGKSIMAQNIAENVAFNAQKTALMFSLEMPKEQVLQRIMSSRSGVKARDTKFGTLSADDFCALGSLADMRELNNIIINDRAVPDLRYVKSVCRQIKRQVKDRLGVIIIDYLQLMQFSETKWNKSDAIGDVTRGLKLMAKELSVPVVCLSQINRGNEKEKNKRPMLSDLRDSGSIEQDADKVLMLYRDEYYNSNSTQKGVIEIIIAKNRQGEIGTVKLSWQAQIMRIMEPKDVKAATESKEKNPWSQTRARIKGEV